MSDTRMNEIRARAHAATPGHWGTAYDGQGTYTIEAQPRFIPGSGAASVNEGIVATLVGEHGDGQTYANADFIASAREDVRYLLDQVAELEADRPVAGPVPAEVFADVVAGVIRDFENDAWASTKDQVAELRYALFEYRDRAEVPAAGSLLGRLSEPGVEEALLGWVMRDDEEPTGPRSDESKAG